MSKRQSVTSIFSKKLQKQSDVDRTVFVIDFLGTVGDNEDMIIDCHTHIGVFNKRRWSADELIKSMDEAGIDVSLIISNFHGGENGTSTKEVIEASRLFPRLKPVGNVDYARMGRQQIRELTELLEKKLILGVKFYLGYQHFYPNDKKLYPIYTLCARNNIPVIFHTGVLEAGFKGLLKFSHPLPVDELATTFPNLKIVMAHFGYPWIVDCAAVIAKNENVYADFSAYFTEYQPIADEGREYFIKQLTEFKFHAGDFKKCLFGTDWPLYSQKGYLAAVKSLPMTEEENELIF